MATRVVGKGNRQWEIEYPTEMNGHKTQYTGFITPLGNNTANSDFFFYYGADSKQEIGFSGYFPQYVRDAALRLARKETK